MKFNPCFLDGFAFLEFSGPDVTFVQNQFQQMGFQKTAEHSHQPVSIYRQGHIQFLINDIDNCQASSHAKMHGAGACAMGFRVKDVEKAFSYAINHGAEAFIDNKNNDHHLPAIKAIGGSVIYFVDDHHQPFANDWMSLKGKTDTPFGFGLTTIDHLTHNVHQGNMEKWADFYQSIFNFEQIRFFDIKGQQTGLVSKAMGSPCGKIKIPLNESKDNQSQIEEFLHDYNGEGIQHIALSTENIVSTVQNLVEHGSHFLDVPDTYYEMISDRLPWYKKPVDALQALKILIDGEKDERHGLLLQIFTENVFGPVFFEIIERQGNEGFGEGNFQALFEAIERDQIRRGTLQEL
ncbi:4-hydroxyphenylpyruvate dioxygenase [Legionella sp. W05-934-2]|jgi:4-hydroxyphenylpyruvate dioxygenase|uniref:4-hydroxyphenylpyruvate dioxygenase n=1 Tax=Legionella sp. W05-934-2 TaxID=1198649 RepID=UPI003461CCE7